MKTRHIEQQLVHDMKVVLQQAEELLEATAEASGKGLDKAREKLRTSVKLLGKRWGQLTDRAGEAARASGRVVREHPYETAGGGLVVLAAIATIIWLWQRPH